MPASVATRFGGKLAKFNPDETTVAHEFKQACFADLFFTISGKTCTKLRVFKDEFLFSQAYKAALTLLKEKYGTKI